VFTKEEASLGVLSSMFKVNSEAIANPRPLKVLLKTFIKRI
jgi:hypothetical protein